MSASPRAQTQARFLGLDLASLGRDLLAAWRGMLDWPLVSWLWPKSDIRVWLPDGATVLSRGLNTPLVHDKSRAGAARFEAILLPETLLLRRTLALPQLQAAEVQAALALEIQSLSPFAPGDVVWAHHISQQNGVGIQVQLVLSSRKLIAQHIAAAHPRLASQNTEVWVKLSEGTSAESGFVALTGYGGSRRAQQNTAWRWASVLLVVLLVVLTAAMAITPTMRLYLKSMQASQALAVLAKKAVPVIEQRESLLRVTEQVVGLNKLVDRPVPPLQTLTLITQALPDDTSLLSLQIQGLKVTMTGQTANAASLMKQLGSTAGLRDVKAPVPATKPMGAPREQFTIEFMLDPAQIPAQMKAAL
jgi:general secretion pathway protein L